MDRKRLLVLAALAPAAFALLAAAALSAESTLGWTVEAQPGVALGATSYLLNEPDPYSLGVRSELIFPLDTATAGLRAGLDKAADERWGWDRLALGLTVLYRFQWIEQNINGYEGWQYADLDVPPDEQYELYAVSSSAPALYYRIMYHLPGVGVAVRAGFPRLELEGSAAHTLFHVSDYDDHLLRDKLSTAKGFGHGLIAACEGRYFLELGRSRLRIYVGVGADVMLLRADTDQTQMFYDGPYEGVVYTGVSHVITSAQLALGLRLGLSY